MGQARDRGIDPSQAATRGDRGSILVPVDGSRPSLAVLPVARAVAGIWRGQPHLLSVTAAPLSTSALTESLGLTEADLAGFTLDQRTGDPAAVILQTTRESKAAVVIMAAHGRTARPSTLLGHVTEAVLRGVPCPLLLVGDEAGRRFMPDHAALSRILLPLDGSVETAEALEAVAPLISRPEVTVDMLHVVPTAAKPQDQERVFTVPRYVDQPQYEWASWQKEFATRFHDGLTPRTVTVHAAVGDPGREILSAARKQKSDLIIMAWKGVFDGDRARTLRTVLADSPCPVLVVQIGMSATAPSGE